jgi:putative tryptophan/tyrosine transport system substrate-binding protein
MALHIRRREFVVTLGSAAAVWPLAARAQQSPMPVVGYLNLGLAEARRDDVVAFQRGLNELGFVEGRNVLIEYRWASNQYERLPDLVSDLIQRRVTMIVAPNGTATTLAAKALTTTIPIVFSTSRDPVGTGLVASLNRPGGNVTGVIDIGSDLEAKQLELLHDLLPHAARFAVLVNPRSPLAEPTIKDAQNAGTAIGKQIEILTASVSSEIDLAFARLAQNRADALLIGPDALFLTRRVQIATMAARHAVPTVFYAREYVEAGGLMSYGSSLAERERQLGLYTGRILKGEKPVAMPILRAARFEFVINLQTAKVIGLEVPPTLLARADEVIE